VENISVKLVLSLLVVFALFPFSSDIQLTPCFDKVIPSYVGFRVRGFFFGNVGRVDPDALTSPLDALGYFGNVL
jgi:hypothetical protein